MDSVKLTYFLLSIILGAAAVFAEQSLFSSTTSNALHDKSNSSSFDLPNNGTSVLHLPNNGTVTASNSTLTGVPRTSRNFGEGGKDKGKGGGNGYGGGYGYGGPPYPPPYPYPYPYPYPPPPPPPYYPYYGYPYIYG